MLVPNRHASIDSYRYGFNGQEKDDEVKGEGNSLNYTFRMHDPRIGRFFAVDPLAHDYPSNSPYAFCENDPINYVELEGLEKSPTKAQVETAIRVTKALISKFDAHLNAVAARGSSDALMNAHSFGIYDAFGGNHIDEYDIDSEKIAYVVGRILGDVTAIVQGGFETEAGGGAAIVGLGAGGVGAVPGLVTAGHGVAITVTGGVDLLKSSVILSSMVEPSSDSTDTENRNTKHTDNRHVDRKKYPEKSKYSKPSQKEKLQKRTIKNPDKITPQNNGRKVYEKDFGRKIGTRGETSHKVVVDPKKKKIVTSYPQKK